MRPSVAPGTACGERAVRKRLLEVFEQIGHLRLRPIRAAASADGIMGASTGRHVAG